MRIHDPPTQAAKTSDFRSLEDFGSLKKITGSQTLLKQLPIDGGRQLVERCNQVAVPRQGRDQARSSVDQLRCLLIHLSENWAALFCSVSISSTTLALNSGVNFRLFVIVDPFPGI